MIRKPIVCVVSEVPKVADILREKCSAITSKITTVDPFKPEEYAIMKDAEVIITEPHHAKLWLYGLPKLKLVQGTWAGIETLISQIPKDAETPNFTYCRYGGSYGVPMSEYVIAYIVAEERKFKMTYKAQEESKWCEEMKEIIWYTSRSLKDLSIGILGLGDIGRVVAEQCKAFGMKVWGLVNTVPSPEDKCKFVDEYRPSKDLDEILSSCDYICNILPSTPLTRGLLDNNRFKACSSKQSVFINVGRGDVCSEQSIIHALDENWLRGAVLDVHNEEPLPSESLLWKHPKITITPHCSAVFTPNMILDQVVTNLENYAYDRPLKYVIDWNKGY